MANADCAFLLLAVARDVQTAITGTSMDAGLPIVRHAWRFRRVSTSWHRYLRSADGEIALGVAVCDCRNSLISISQPAPFMVSVPYDVATMLATYGIKLDGIKAGAIAQSLLTATEISDMC